MKPARLGPIPLDLCFPCSGVWFDYGELAQLVQGGPEAIRKLGQRLYSASPRPTGGAVGKCPVCWIPLGDFEFPSMPGVRLDGCGLCQGFWMTLSTLGIILKRLEEKQAAETAARATRDIPANPGLYPAPPIIPREAPGSNLASPAAVPATAAGSTGPGPQAVPRPAPPRPVERKCPTCGEANSPGAAVCWACGGFMQPAGLGKCPACAATMSREVLDTVDLGFCGDCGGVWLDERKLDALRAQPVIYQEDLVYALRDKTGNGVPLPDVVPSCPRCHVSLMPELLGMVSVEPIQTCPQCYGSYLERGRLAELLIGKRL